MADEFVAQEEIDLEALDKALAMAERAREIQAQVCCVVFCLYCWLVCLSA